jgi:phosphate transport system substrate-binding protein
VKRTRIAGLSVLGLAGSLALVGCGGSDSADSGTSPGTGGNINCVAGEVKGEGSSAQKNAIEEWKAEYESACPDATVDYQASGSGAGIKAFIAGTVDFGGTDSVMKPAEITSATARCQNGTPLHLPAVVGPIAVSYNLPGVDKLTLTADVAAKIFSSKITKWNDPAIAAANPGVTLPDAAITTFHRSDSSGTTDNFTKWLKAAAPASWTAAPGKEWVAPGGQGAKGNDGVGTGIKDTPNSIGYVEWSFAKNNELSYAAIDNGGGAVELTAETAAKAVEDAEVIGTGKDLQFKLDYATKDPGAYPVVLVAYELVCETGNKADRLPALKGWLTYIYSADAQGMLGDIGYGPMPESVLTKVRTTVAALA